MSASQIPNLNSLRRGGPRGVSRRTANTERDARSKDTIIQNTDNDAATSRLSAVEAGYLNDPFARLLTTSRLQQRLPLMNRGTYARTTGIDLIVKKFLLSSQGRKQIISLGAGSDTRFFRLKRDDPGLDLVYHEIDFESNTKTKIEQLKQSADTIKTLSGVDFVIEQDQLQCINYFLHARDLRTLNEETSLPGMENIPTLLISECCLIYLSPDDADRVLKYFVGALSHGLVIVIYEPIRPHDSFGRTMVRNLTARGIHLQTLEKYANLEDQRKRLSDHGFTAKSIDIDLVWQKWTSDQEKERIDKLEWLDEVEEFQLLAKHYCLTWAWKDLQHGHVMQELQDH